MDEEIAAVREVIMGFFVAREAATGSQSPINGYEAEAIAKRILEVLATQLRGCSAHPPR